VVSTVQPGSEIEVSEYLGSDWVRICAPADLAGSCVRLRSSKNDRVWERVLLRWDQQDTTSGVNVSIHAMDGAKLIAHADPLLTVQQLTLAIVTHTCSKGLSPGNQLFKLFMQGAEDELSPAAQLGALAGGAVGGAVALFLVPLGMLQCLFSSHHACNVTHAPLTQCPYDPHVSQGWSRARTATTSGGSGA
jgi:hypothetical protein